MRDNGNSYKVEDCAGSVVLKNFIDKLFIFKIMNKVNDWWLAVFLWSQVRSH